MIFQNDKTPFQALKTRSSKSRGIDIFPKGLTHGFDTKMAIFPTFFFQAMQARKMSFMIFQNEKTPFQAIKTRSLKTQTIDIFPNGLTHDLGPKMPIYQSLLFSQYRPGKCLLWTKKRLRSQKKSRSSKSRKIDIFPKGLTHFFGGKINIYAIFFFTQYRPGKCLLRYSRTKKRLSRL